jgi:hypothetical protein
VSASIAHLCGAIVVAQQRRLVLMQEDVEHVAYASTGWRREWRRVERSRVLDEVRTGRGAMAGAREAPGARPRILDRGLVGAR